MARFDQFDDRVEDALGLSTLPDIAQLRPWEIYVEDACWPSITGMRFIVAAAAEIAWIKFGINPRDIAFDDDAAALRDEVSASIGDLLMRGSLIASARPVGGGRIVPVAEAEWTPDLANAAVSTGVMPRRHRSRKSHPHHVMIGSGEAALMTRVYSITNMLAPREDQGGVEELGSIILGNLSAIAGNKVALAPEGSARRVIELLMPSIKPSLGADDQDKLVAAVSRWLVNRFEQDARDATGMRRDDFRDETVERFSPFVTKRLFEKVWANAVAMKIGSVSPHRCRSNPGRRKTPAP